MNTNNKNIALSAVTGAAIGALVAVLIKKKVIITHRSRLLTKGKEVVDEMEEKFDELLQSLTQAYDCVRRETKHVGAILRDK